MKSTILSSLLAALALVGCEQASQSLPFTVDDVVEQTIAAGGGMVSTPAGASVEFPSGSVASAVQVSLEVLPAAQGASASGTPVSETFKLGPSGLRLEQAAMAELKFSPAGDRARAWLASVVSVRDGEVEEHGDTRVELRTGLASTEISRLGTLSVVIPPADAMVPVTRTTVQANRVPAPRLFTAAVSQSVSVECGDPNDRCAGVTATATANLLEQVQDAAAVYPAISGRLGLRSPSTADSIVLDASVRALLGSGQTAENVTIHAVVRPTPSTVVSESASEIRLSNVHFRVSGDSDTGSGTQEEISSLVITRTVSGGRITLSRSFSLRNASGELEDATITLAFPVEVTP